MHLEIKIKLLLHIVPNTIYHMDAKTFFSKVVLMRKAQKDYFKCRTQQNLRKCKALETEIDGEIERVNSITGVSSVSKEPRQTNLFTD